MFMSHCDTVELIILATQLLGFVRIQFGGVALCGSNASEAVLYIYCTVYM